MHRPSISATLRALALIPLFAGCGGGAGTGPAAFPAALVGRWQAGPACAAAGCAINARVEGSSLVLPLTDTLTIDLQVSQGGAIVSTLAFAGQAPRIVQGLARARGSTLIVDYPGSPSDTIAYAVQGALLRFDFQNALLLPDVTGDGTPDHLRMSVLFARQ